jgi:MYXO-CTERM domain-containing protein
MPLNMLKMQFAPTIVRLPLLFVGLCASELTLNLFSGMSARALTVTNSEAFSPVLQVDGGIRNTGLIIGDLGASVTNVLLSVSLTKCGGLVPIDPSGVCNSPAFSFNSEIQLFLQSPAGTFAQMVYQDDLSGQKSGATVTWNFQDSFSSPVGGSSLVSGNYPNYKSAEPFSIFNGENPNGSWRLYYEDTTPGGPLSINSWSIAVTDETGPGPGPSPADVPGPLPLFGLAAAFGWSRLLRQRTRARRDLRSGS